MPRHSKNNTAGAFNTHHEKQISSYGTQKARLGRDSQIPFGFCALSLEQATDPVASPSGDIYCRECIYKYLLEQRKKLKRAQRAYEAEQAELAEEAARKVREGEQQKLKDFVAANEDTTSSLFKAKGAITASSSSASSASSSSSSSSSGAGGGAGATASQARARAALKAEKEAEAAAFLQRKFIPRDEVNTVKELKRTSFWTPASQPLAGKGKLKKPDTAARDPMHPHKFLRLKQLIDVNFRRDPDAKKGAGAGSGGFICAVTRKPITHQKAVLLRPSGEVILESCVKTLVTPTMKCPITGKTLRKKDVIKLTAGGTGFSSHNKVEAKVYRPNLI